MKDPRTIIRRPVITEKSYGLMDDGKYTFVVDPRSNKTEIKIAIEKIFDVKVVKIATQNRQGKVKRRGYTTGKRPNTKRAIVTLAEGDSIDYDADI